MNENGDERFIELWNDYLEGELDETGMAELRTLVEGNDHLSQMAADTYQMHCMLGLIAKDSPARQEDFVAETMERLPAGEQRFVDRVMQRLSRRATRKVATGRAFFAKWRFSGAAVAVVAILFVAVYIQRPGAERQIAKISGLSGPLQWTGNGGLVSHDLNLGTKLSGGTIEGIAPDSWFELEFNDRSTIAISGNSMLTFSDHGQKHLYLKAGSVSADVRPQPTDKPMMIHTRSALLEVVGTRFEVETGLSETMLNVSEGKVRVKRRSDGKTVEVPAKQRVVAAADREMLPAPAPVAVHRWRSQLHLGPTGGFGKWSPRTNEKEAKLRAVPITVHEGMTIYVTSLDVSHGDKPPVILQPASRLRVRGRIASSNNVWFGITLWHLDGEFAGRFQTIRPAAEFHVGEEFEVFLQFKDYHLDPTLTQWKEKLPHNPYHLAIESLWCHTLDKQAGLEILEVELIPPGEDTSI